MNQGHVPVLLDAVLRALSPCSGEVFADATAGLGGHARAVARRLSPGGTVILNDVDPSNLRAASASVCEVPGIRVESICGNFAALPREMASRGMCASLVLADLGFASTQIDDPARGMSFRADGPLDMRMDPSLRTTAADLVASLPENELARIVRELGEERHAARVARAIIEARRVSPLVTTTQFAEVVRRVVPRQAGGIDPATRTFQALRIAVNDELGVLDAFLSGILRRTEQIVGGLQEGAGEVAPPASRGWLAPGGRVAIISFHSLEDRLVKKAFQAITRLGGRELSGKSVAPTEEELRRNPRSRSAKLRAVQLPSGSV